MSLHLSRAQFYGAFNAAIDAADPRLGTFFRYQVSGFSYRGRRVVISPRFINTIILPMRDTFGRHPSAEWCLSFRILWNSLFETSSFLVATRVVYLDPDASEISGNNFHSRPGSRLLSTSMISLSFTISRLGSILLRSEILML